jgi:hypothetical protein
VDDGRASASSALETILAWMTASTLASWALIVFTIAAPSLRDGLWLSVVAAPVGFVNAGDQVGEGSGSAGPGSHSPGLRQSGGTQQRLSGVAVVPRGDQAERRSWSGRTPMPARSGGPARAQIPAHLGWVVGSGDPRHPPRNRRLPGSP